MSTLNVVLTILAVSLFGASILLGALFGAKLDGRRQALRNQGLHPVTTPSGNVTAQEFQQHTDQEQSHGSSSTGHDTPAQRLP